MENQRLDISFFDVHPRSELSDSNRVFAFLYLAWLEIIAVQKLIGTVMTIQEMIVVCPFQRVLMVLMVRKKVRNRRNLQEVVEANRLLEQEWVLIHVELVTLV